MSSSSPTSTSIGSRPVGLHDGHPAAGPRIEAVDPAAHPELPRDAHRRGVARVDDREDLLEPEDLPGVAEARPSGLGRQPAPPGRARQPPADLDGRQDAGQERGDREPGEADQPAAAFLGGPQAEAVLVPMALDPREQLVALLTRPRTAIADETHDAGV